jgi:hypothetical protein
MCTRENIKVSISIIYGILDSRQFLSVDYLLPGGWGGGGGGGGGEREEICLTFLHFAQNVS